MSTVLEQGTQERIGSSAEEARRIVAEAARLYFADRRALVDGFVDRHFSLLGSAVIHRKALGWDILRVPVNVLLAVPNVAVRLAALAAGVIGAKRARAFLDSRRIFLETAVDREIEWLIMTELLELPYRQGQREARKDALAEAILRVPQMRQALDRLGEAAGSDPDFRRRLGEALATYAGTRTAAAEITTAVVTLGAGAVTVKQATPGAMALGPALAATVAQQSAIASFPLGATLGALWYGWFPVAAPPLLIMGLTGGLVVAGAVASAFAGILADPIQRRLGLHRRRLERLIATLERQVCARDFEANFVVRDHYVARVLSVFELIASFYGLARR